MAKRKFQALKMAPITYEDVARRQAEFEEVFDKSIARIKERLLKQFASDGTLCKRCIAKIEAMAKG